jgi:hypothetical protein
MAEELTPPYLAVERTLGKDKGAEREKQDSFA